MPLLLFVAVLADQLPLRTGCGLVSADEPIPNNLHRQQSATADLATAFGRRLADGL
jgi:hypothetical protein